MVSHIFLWEFSPCKPGECFFFEMGWKPLDTTNFCIFCIIEPNDSLNGSLDLTPSNSGIHEGSTTQPEQYCGLKGCPPISRGGSWHREDMPKVLPRSLCCWGALRWLYVKGAGDSADSWWTQDILLNSFFFWAIKGWSVVFFFIFCGCVFFWWRIEPQKAVRQVVNF